MKKAVRLDKFLADAGAGTRSEVKKFIQKGKVQVNGVPAKKSEIKVSEEDDPPPFPAMPDTPIHGSGSGLILLSVQNL